VVVFVPLVVMLTSAKGAVGAAEAWIFLYFGYILTEISLMHRRIMKGEQRSWYLIDCGIPLCASLVVGYMSRWFAPLHTSILSTLPFLALALLAAVAASACSAPDTRHWLKDFVINGVTFLSKRLRDQSRFESTKT